MTRAEDVQSAARTIAKITVARTEPDGKLIPK